MDEKLLKIENLSKSYNAQTQALADVNITLDKGEFVVVIGPSGAGKSTLIRCINRMIEPTEGKIVFDGTEITSMNNRQMRKVRTQIGMIFQNYNLIDRTSVIKNVLHGRLGQMSFWESLFGLYRQDASAGTDRTCGTKVQTSRRVKRRPNAACRYLPESDSKSQIDSG